MSKKIRELLYSAGGRKFIIGLIACFWLKGVNTALLWFEKLNQSNYVKLEDTIMWLLLGLFTANVASKFIEFRKGDDDETNPDQAK